MIEVMEIKELTVDVSWNGENFEASAKVGNDWIVATDKNYDKIFSEFESALEFHFEDKPNPSKFKLNYVKDGATILKLLDGTVTRTTISKYTGVSSTQLGHYIQGVKKPRPETSKKITNGVKAISNSILETL